MIALILVDIQNDFCPGGALAVPDGDAVVAVANRLAALADLVVATQDLHPADHLSFAANHPGKSIYEVVDLGGLPQVLWPVHCVQASPGAAFHPDLDLRRVMRVFPKGTDREIDSYSGFFDNGRRRSTGLHPWLRDQGVDTVWIVGLATDYCVKATALDAARIGYRTLVVVDGCRGVGIRPEDVPAALDELRGSGVEIVEAAEITER